MATTKFFFDTRRSSGPEFPLRINIYQRRNTAALTLGVKLTKEQWDTVTNTVINHPESKYWNNFISRRKVEIDTLILKLEDLNPQKINSMSTVEIRDFVIRAGAFPIRL